MAVGAFFLFLFWYEEPRQHIRVDGQGIEAREIFRTVKMRCDEIVLLEMKEVVGVVTGQRRGSGAVLGHHVGTRGAGTLTFRDEGGASVWRKE